MTNDGDTKAAVETVRSELYESADLVENRAAYAEAVAALDLITTTLSEQEAELEQLRGLLAESQRLLGIVLYGTSQDSSELA